MSAATGQQVTAQAEHLRRLADALESSGIAGLKLFVSVRPAAAAGRGEADRVAVVNTLAARLGLPDARSAMSGACWSHQASSDLDGVHLQVTTFIDVPRQRCACGATCAHGGVA